MLRQILIDELRSDQVLTQTLYRDDGTMLLRKGCELTETILRTLRNQGCAPVYVDDDGCLDGLPAEEATAGAYQPAIDLGQSDRCLPYRPDTAVRVERLVESTSEMVNQLSGLLIDGELADAAPFLSASESLLSEIRGDQDQTLHQVLTEEDDRDLAHRCTQLSVLSMSIAAQMALSDEQIKQVGTAALLHDIALFGLPEDQRVPSDRMTPEAKMIFGSHPALAERLLESVGSVDLTVQAVVVRAVVAQAHEQLDGSGFPQGLTAHHINKLARIVNLADAYLTLVHPGLGRTGMFPADAMAYLMHHACAGRFDPSVMKGLLRTLSLYPIGSLVQLSDNSRARVLRARGEDPQQPVVLREDGAHALIDLRDSPLRVRQPLVDKANPSRRLVARNIDHVMWGMYAGTSATGQSVD